MNAGEAKAAVLNVFCLAVHLGGPALFARQKYERAVAVAVSEETKISIMSL